MQFASPSRFVTRVRVAASAVAAASLLATASFAAGGGPKEAGVWIDETGKGAVKIEPCGDKLCGRIVWLKDLVNAQGEVLTDRYNPDAAQRTRTICGLPVLGQLQAVSEGGYDGGWVYDPKVGKSYSVAILLTGRDELTVTGYKGVKLLGKSFLWTRAKTELPSCEASAEAPAPAPKAAAGNKPAAGAAKPKAGSTEALPWANKQKPAASGAGQ